MRVCDRCGEKIQENILATIQYPYGALDIKIYYSVMDWTKIDLCENCKKKILDFVLKGDKNNDE